MNPLTGVLVLAATIVSVAGQTIKPPFLGGCLKGPAGPPCTLGSHNTCPPGNTCRPLLLLRNPKNLPGIPRRGVCCKDSIRRCPINHSYIGSCGTNKPCRFGARCVNGACCRKRISILGKCPRFQIPGPTCSGDRKCKSGYYCYKGKVCCRKLKPPTRKCPSGQLQGPSCSSTKKCPSSFYCSPTKVCCRKLKPPTRKCPSGQLQGPSCSIRKKCPSTFYCSPTKVCCKLKPPTRKCPSGQLQGPSCSSTKKCPSDFYCSPLKVCCRKTTPPATKCPLREIEGPSCSSTKKCPFGFYCSPLKVCCQTSVLLQPKCPLGQLQDQTCGPKNSCKAGFYCYQGSVCCQNPPSSSTCPFQQIPGPPCNSPKSECPAGYVCYKGGRCCGLGGSNDGKCPPVIRRPMSECPLLILNHCKTDSDCRGGVCCSDECGRRTCRLGISKKP